MRESLVYEIRTLRRLLASCRQERQAMLRLLDARTRRAFRAAYDQDDQVDQVDVSQRLSTLQSAVRNLIYVLEDEVRIPLDDLRDTLDDTNR